MFCFPKVTDIYFSLQLLKIQILKLSVSVCVKLYVCVCVANRD